MLPSDKALGFHLIILLLFIGVLKHLNQMSEAFVFLFLSPKSSGLFSSVLLPRLHSASFVLSSKLIFVNLFNSGVVIKLLVLGILESISIAFILRSALVARLAIPGILFSTSVIFAFRAAVATKSVILGISFSIAVIFYIQISLLD